MKRRANRRPSRPHLLAIAAILLLLTAPCPGFSLGPWTNGQAANLVLGQPDFTTARNCDIEECNGADRMYRPQAVAVDPTTGKVFVADSSNNRVLRFASGAALANGAAAEAVLGQPDFVTTTWATTSAASMAGPQAVAVDAEGRLWVADTWNFRVLRFDNAASKANGANADAVLGQADFTSDADAIGRNKMDSPVGITITATGALFVSDSKNHRILRFDNAANKGNGADADGVLGQPDFITRVVGYQVRNGLYYPTGVSYDSEGRLYVADGEGKWRGCRQRAGAA